MCIIVIIFILVKMMNKSQKLYFYLFEFLLIRLFMVGGSLMATLK